MSGVGFRMSVDGDLGLTPIRRRINDKKALLNVGGRSGRNHLQAHLRAKNRVPNKLGGRRTNFYAKAADSVNYRLLNDNEVVVSINAIGVAFQYHGTGEMPGGVLRPISATYLTIPAAPEAHGKRAGEFPDLEVAFAYDPKLGRERLALVRREATLLVFKRRKVAGVMKRVALPGAKQGGEPIFWLQRSVKKAADPSVLPTQEDLTEAVVYDIEEYIGLLTERSA